MLKLCTRIALILGMTLFAGNAFAEGFALYEYSARGIALGGATVARTPDPSALAYNPSLITKLKGAQIQAGISAVTPAGKMKTWDAAGNSSTTSLHSNTWPVPSFYYTQEINDKITVGVGEFSRFGLGFEYPHNWPGRYNVYAVNLQTVSVQPTVALAATDKLSLALGLEIMYVNFDLSKRVGVPVAYGPTRFGTLEMDSDINDAKAYSFGVNLSGHYQFNEQWAAGLIYRSKMQVRAWGDVDYSSKGYTGVQNPVALMIADKTADAFKDGNAHAEVIMPDSLAAGVSWTPMKNLSFEAGAVWTRWSTFHSLRIHLPTPDGKNISESKKDWDDTWRFNIGVEYSPLDWLTLRAGYVYDMSPMTTAHQDYLVPTDGRNIYSAGVGFKWNDLTLDLAYAYIDPMGRSYQARPEEGILTSKTKNTRTDIFSASVGYKF